MIERTTYLGRVLIRARPLEVIAARALAACNLSIAYVSEFIMMALDKPATIRPGKQVHKCGMKGLLFNEYTFFSV